MNFILKTEEQNLNLTWTILITNSPRYLMRSYGKAGRAKAEVLNGMRSRAWLDNNGPRETADGGRRTADVVRERAWSRRAATQHAWIVMKTNRRASKTQSIYGVAASFRVGLCVSAAGRMGRLTAWAWRSLEARLPLSQMLSRSLSKWVSLQCCALKLDMKKKAYHRVVVWNGRTWEQLCLDWGSTRFGLRR